MLFIGSCSGTFYALNKTSGKRQWSYDISIDGRQTSFHGDPFVDGGTLIVGADHSCAPDGIGHLYAFNIADGMVRWKYSSPVGLSTNLVRAGSIFWVGTVAGDWVAIDSRRGTMNTRVPSPAPERPCEIPKWLAIAGDSIYAVGRDDLVYSLSSKTGRVNWKVGLPAPPSTSPVVLREEVLVGSRDQQIYRLARRDGEIKASLPVKGVPAGRPLVAGDRVFIIIDDPEVDHHAVVALDQRGLLWSSELSSEQTSERPYLWNGMAIVGDCTGKVTAIRPDSGKIAWRLELQGCIRSIGGDDTSLFVGVEQGTVFALRR